MEIRVLRYFLTVVREESITKASEVLHITQPTLSRQLAQMEEDIGVKLFDRGTRKIKLTNEGILLRRRAEEILQLVDKTEKELVEQEEQVEGKISIGCGEIAAVQLLPKIIESFRRKYPRVTFDIFTATADLVKEQMDKGLLDPEHLEGGQKNFENGDITYCEAHHNMAIFYAQTDNPVLSVDVIPIGRVTSDLSVFENLDSREEVIFSLAE